jgi:alpha-tubulin suppressor-like RCC1 family protein
MRSKILTAVLLALLVALAPTGVGPAGARSTAEATSPALTGVVSVAAGSSQSCALLRNHRVRCWGDNSYGGLGDGSTTPRSRAVLVRNPDGTGPLTDATAIATGNYHTCALLATRQVACWGDNGDGQLGIGSTEAQRVLPTLVANESGESALDDVAQITAGGNATCARLLSGQVRCWGHNAFHELGNGTDDGSDLPVAVSSIAGGGPLTGVTQIDGGDAHTCARVASGGVVCWGSNTLGRLGDGTADGRLRPVAVVGPGGTGVLGTVRRVSAGGTFSCAVLVDRTARCWGGGQYGQLGNAATDDHVVPVAVLTRAGGPPLARIGSLAAAYGHACARLTTNQVRCWGNDGDDELGNGPGGPNRSVPTVVRAVSGPGPLTGVAQVQANGIHTCVRLANGQARCWGFGADGQLGNGRNVNRPRPVIVRRSTAG